LADPPRRLIISWLAGDGHFDAEEQVDYLLAL
jgi:hypothetical protein